MPTYCTFCGADATEPPSDGRPDCCPVCHEQDCWTNTKPEVREWIFTFGSGQQHAGCYHTITGTLDGARLRMFERFGPKWSMMYTSREKAGVYRFNLREVK